MSNIKPTSDKQTKENDKTKAIKKKKLLGRQEMPKTPNVVL